MKFYLTTPRGAGIVYWKTKQAGCTRLTSRFRQRGQYGRRRPGYGARVFVRVLGRHPRFCFVVLWQNVEGGVSAISNVTHQLNEDIRDKELRLIGSGGEQLGIMSADEALRIADEKGLDLVKISPQANPPVCKLMDYGKFRFEQGKREKEARKNQHVVEIKEIRMSPGIDVGDFNVKLKNAQKFLTEGNRVKVSVRFRGREMAHTEIGRKLLDKFAEQCAEIANVDKGAKLEGRNMSMFLSPKK